MLYTNRHGQKMVDALRDALGGASSAWLLSAYVGPDACNQIGLEERGRDIPVRLVVGRALTDGLPRETLTYLRWLEGSLSVGGGGIRAADPPFHSKAYCFDLRNGGRVAWIGSSNLSGNGLDRWTEANVSPLDDRTMEELANEANSAWHTAVRISSDKIPIVERPPPAKKDRPRRSQDVEDPIPVEPNADGVPGLRVTLLNPSTGEVQDRSGLNWAFGRGRPRDPDEALVALRAAQLEAARPVFGSIQPRTRFTALTHDGQTLSMMLEGGRPEAAKNICSADDKTILGNWILRQVLSHPRDTPIRREHLERYGRTDLGFYRIGTDPETGRALIFMDFRPEDGSA